MPRHFFDIFAVSIISLALLFVGLVFSKSTSPSKLFSGLSAAAVAAPIKPSLPALKPNATTTPEVSARAFLSVYIAPDGTTGILAEQESHEQLPIASLTKLMTTIVASLELNAEATTTVSEKVFTVQTLLDSALIESNNDSAEALARLGNLDSREDFIKQMNDAAMVLAMEDTRYINPTGLDEGNFYNYSSAYDLSLLTKEILFNQLRILKIIGKPEAPIMQVDGTADHLAQNTNELLSSTRWPAEVWGGKTGTTDLAKKNLVLILKDKASGGYLINIVLGTDDNFAEMTKLLDWIYASYDL